MAKVGGRRDFQPFREITRPIRAVKRLPGAEAGLQVGLQVNQA